MKIVFRDISEQVFVVTTPEGTDLVEWRKVLEKINPSYIFCGEVEESTLPNVLADDSSIQEYVLEGALPVLRPVEDKVRCCREAWRWDGTQVLEDVNLARKIRAARVRKIRNKMLKDSDQEEFRQSGQALQRVRRWRRRLRDLGAEIDTNPQKITWPVKPEALG